MLLVYAMTRAASRRLGRRRRRSRSSAAAARSSLAFVVIELRSPSPLLPLRIFRLRTLAGANAAMAIVGAVAFSEFFLLTLYLQDVLHYSAVAERRRVRRLRADRRRRLERRAGGRRTLRRPADADRRPARLGRSRSRWLTRLPVDGHYFWDLFPAFVLGGAGMGLSFVPVTIAA